MLDILNLALPFFGVILLGFACGKWRRLPDEGLAWMNFFIIYVTLPALFFRILSKTPLEQLAQVDFIVATTLATACAFALAFVAGLALRRGRVDEALLAGVTGGFGNVGYMGPGLALAMLGSQASMRCCFSWWCRWRWRSSAPQTPASGERSKMWPAASFSTHC
jgi:predicted permease